MTILRVFWGKIAFRGILISQYLQKMLLLFWSILLCRISSTLLAFLRNSNSFFWISFLKFLVLSKWSLRRLCKSFRRSLILSRTLLAETSSSTKSGVVIDGGLSITWRVAFDFVGEFGAAEYVNTLPSVWSLSRGDDVVLLLLRYSYDLVLATWWCLVEAADGELLDTGPLSVIARSFAISASASEWVSKLIVFACGLRGVDGDSIEWLWKENIECKLCWIIMLCKEETCLSTTT